MLRFMPQDWEPHDWMEAHAARVARRVAQLRDPRSAQWLSDKTAELGFRVSRSVITDLENGRRKYIAVHELVLLAKALGASPLELLYGKDDALEVEYTPEVLVSRIAAVEQFSGIDETVLREYEWAMSQALELTEGAVKALEVLSRMKRNTGIDDGG